MLSPFSSSRHPRHPSPWASLKCKRRLGAGGLGCRRHGLSRCRRVPLGRASEWHIALIAVAFVAVVLAMYLLPSVAPAQFGGKARGVSWGLAGGTALSVFLGHSILPIGVGQRLAAACVVIGSASPERGCVAREYAVLSRGGREPRSSIDNEFNLYAGLLRCERLTNTEEPGFFDLHACAKKVLNTRRSKRPRGQRASKRKYGVVDPSGPGNPPSRNEKQS